ncbi:hypothetical protein FZC79_17545 [Rossellomorea vietnamensis]|uniref:Uncharacterized protein n=1 Tax=Rossellomorea vietnamensis TaxID=218284 RepID=A0A5D4KAF0_9BACI|nr:hypothetical protein [Rossellomorea vietnamensis]TYR73680.1 hypothetical protein FZC79_17545 [Rossellomorea vietnamensis]
MKHIPYEDWLKYVEDGLGEPVREQYEEHLYSCDHCMEIYLAALQFNETSLPALPDALRFTDQVMADVLAGKQKETPGAGKEEKFYQRAAFHYIVAAAMTILLMTTGVFQQMIGFAEEFQRNSGPSVTTELMNKTTDFINNVENETRKERNE